MKRQSVLAIDVGATKVAWAIGQPGLDRRVAIPGQPPRPPFDLLGCGVAPLAASNGDWPADPMRVAETLERALNEAGISRMPEYAVASLSHPALQHRQVTAHVDLADEPVTIRGRDLERVQALAVTQTLSVDREVLVVEPLGYSGNGFSGVQDPRGLNATRLSGAFHLVTIPVAVRRVMLQALELLGVELEEVAWGLKAAIASGMVDPPTNASTKPIGGGVEPWRGERVLLADLGGSSSDVALLDHGVLVNAQTVPWGGKHQLNELRGHLEAFLHPPTNCQVVPTDRSNTALRRATLTGSGAATEPIGGGIHDELPPARAVVTGRAALIDGLLEGFEAAVGVPTALGRSPWARALGELPRQVALSPVLGMLALSINHLAPARAPFAPSGLLDRVVNRTRQILVEYF